MNARTTLLLSVEAVAEMLSLGERTVWRWSKNGRMPKAIKIGGRRLFRSAEIHRWVGAGCPMVDGNGDNYSVATGFCTHCVGALFEGTDHVCLGRECDHCGVMVQPGKAHYCPNITLR